MEVFLKLKKTHFFMSLGLQFRNELQNKMNSNNDSYFPWKIVPQSSRQTARPHYA